MPLSLQTVIRYSLTGVYVLCIIIFRISHALHEVTFSRYTHRQEALVSELQSTHLVSTGSGTGESHWRINLTQALNPRGTFTGEFKVYGFARIIKRNSIVTLDVRTISAQLALGSHF